MTQPPSQLNDEGRKIWTETRKALLAAGTIQQVNEDALLCLVAAVQNHRRATSLISQTDVVIDQGGKVAQSPLIQVQREAATTIAQFTKQFGLTRKTLKPVTQPMSETHPKDDGTWFCDTHQVKHGHCHNKDGSRCHMSLPTGLTVCLKHGGKSPGQAAKHLAALEAKRNPIMGDPMDIGPAESLLWRTRVLAGEVARLDAIVANLEGDELVWGKTEEVTEETAEFESRRIKRASRISMWQQFREAREKMLYSNAEAAHRAGVEEHLIRLAEMQAMMVHKVILASLSDLGIPPDDPRIGEVVPRRIAELTA